LKDRYYPLNNVRKVHRLHLKDSYFPLITANPALIAEACPPFFLQNWDNPVPIAGDNFLRVVSGTIIDQSPQHAGTFGSDHYQLPPLENDRSYSC